MERRRARFEILAVDHWEKGYGWACYGKGIPETNPRGAWNWSMFVKYEQAAHSPWLPVAPDPPEPD
jgi:hypothetical protein